MDYWIMSLIDDLLKKNGHNLINIADKLFEEGQNVIFQNSDGTYTKKYQDGKVEIFNYADDGSHKIIKIYYE